MEIYLELNRRFGTGYQIRIVHGPMNKVYDKEPLTMYEAGACTETLLAELNKTLGTNYKAHQVIRATNEALEANARYDLASAKFLQDIKSQKYELSTPDKADYMKKVIDGEEEVCFTGRGVVKMAYFLWTDEKNPRARESLKRYCQYISAHGYKGGAKKALAALDQEDKDGAMEWIHKTYARHVHDDAGLIQFLLHR